VFVTRVIEFVMIILVVRAVLSIALPMLRKNPPPQSKTPPERFDDKGKDIVDGDYKELS
jgi:hypothetical protein